MTGVRFPDEMSEKIEGWANRQPDKPRKAEAIRRLVALGLKAKPSTRKPAK